MNIFAEVCAIFSSASTASSWSLEVSFKIDVRKSRMKESILFITSSGIKLLELLHASSKSISETICFT